MTNSFSLGIIVPVYNIEKYVAKCLETIRKQTYTGIEVIVVDDGSTVLFGYHYAIKNRAGWIFQTDSDGQTNPAEFEKFWGKKNKYDAILGNRVVRGDGKGRKFVENAVCFLLRLIFGVKVKDANAPFRLKTNNRCELLKECIEA